MVTTVSVTGFRVMTMFFLIFLQAKIITMTFF